MEASSEVTGLQRVVPPQASSDSRLRFVAENSPVVIFAFDEAGTITLAEGRDHSAEGRSAVGQVGTRLDDLTRDMPEAGQAVRRALAGEASEIAAKIRDRQYVFRYRPEYDVEGSVIGALSVGTDVTHEVETVDRTTLRETRFEALVSRSADVAVIGDASSGEITYVSPAVTRLFRLATGGA